MGLLPRGEINTIKKSSLFVFYLAWVVGEKGEGNRRGQKKTPKEKRGMASSPPPPRPATSYACHTKACSCMKLYFNDWGRKTRSIAFICCPCPFLQSWCRTGGPWRHEYTPAKRKEPDDYQGPYSECSPSRQLNRHWYIVGLLEEVRTYDIRCWYPGKGTSV